MFGSKKQDQAAENWAKTKGAIQILIGKADEDLTDSELTDAILEASKSQQTEAKTEEIKEEIKEEKTDKAAEKSEKSEFTLLMEKIDLFSSKLEAQGERLGKIEAMKANNGAGGLREVKETQKTQFDSKKDAPIFVED